MPRGSAAAGNFLITIVDVLSTSEILGTQLIYRESELALSVNDLRAQQYTQKKIAWIPGKMISVFLNIVGE